MFFFFHTRLHLVHMLSRVRHWRDRLVMVLGGVEVVQQMREDVPTLGHDLRSLVKRFLLGLLHVGPGNVELLTQAELAVSVPSLVRHG